MQKVSHRFEFQRKMSSTAWVISNVFFWRLPQNYFASLVRLNSFRYDCIHTYSEVCNFLCDEKEHSSACQQSQAFPFEHSPFLKAWHVGWFSFHEKLVPFGLPLPKEFLHEELDREPIASPLDSRLFSGTCFTTLSSSRTKTFRRPVCAISNISFPLPSDLFLLATKPRRPMRFPIFLFAVPDF